MTYRIARNGQIYGPYSLLEVERHIASGHIIASDLAQGDTHQEWFTIADLFPTSAAQDPPPYPGGVPQLFPDPPDLRWWIALILDLLTFGLFFVAWDVLLAAWMRRIDRNSIAVWLYGAAALLFVINLPASWRNIEYTLFDGMPVDSAHSYLFIGGGFLLRLVARFLFRSELLRHFNRREPLGLQLNWFLTLLFGGLYFQYHFNAINDVKRALRISVPTL